MNFSLLFQADILLLADPFGGADQSDPFGAAPAENGDDPFGSNSQSNADSDDSESWVEV